jgi:hypothetical protein
LSLVPADARGDYGFTKNDILAQAYLGEPFNLYTIKPSALLAYQAGDSVPALLTQTNIWYFPVMIQNEVRALLAVSQQDGKWQAVGFGYVNLAKQLQGVMQQWPKSKGFHPCLITIFQAKQYLLMVPEENANNLISLTPQKSGLALENAGNVLERLKPIVQENLKEKF